MCTATTSAEYDSVKYESAKSMLVQNARGLVPAQLYHSRCWYRFEGGSTSVVVLPVARWYECVWRGSTSVGVGVRVTVLR